jgi:hypothetical protein
MNCARSISKDGFRGCILVLDHTSSLTWTSTQASLVVKCILFYFHFTLSPSTKILSSFTWILQNKAMLGKARQIKANISNVLILYKENLCDVRSKMASRVCVYQEAWEGGVHGSVAHGGRQGFEGFNPGRVLRLHVGNTCNIEIRTD